MDAQWAEMADARPVELEPDHTGVRKKESNGTITLGLACHFRTLHALMHTSKTATPSFLHTIYSNI